MNPIKDLRGIITVLNTPFTSDDKLDIQSLLKNVLLAIESGVAGFLVPAMASEVSKLSESEKNEMVIRVVEAADGRAAVIGGTSASSKEEMLRLAESNLKAGCQGILANIPYENDEQYEDAVRNLDALKPDFLMLQDWDFSGWGLPTSLIESLFREIPSFKCLKIETVPAGVKYSEILDKTEGKLHLSGGWAVSQMLEGLERGVHAFMPTGMHRIYCGIFEYFHSDRKKEARELFEKLQPVLAFSNQHLDISIHFFKRLLWKQGVYNTPSVRKPILPFDNIHLAEADYHIQKIIELERNLKV
ncbi:MULTISPECIES: dihydrodipicolinate synthase family protein [unclassified Oceanispirochaeta]|uniref:dihydrodipicolinate synthase family protein n=1 Tax=unclassified Oceanispirochaeta TaxID=2635722 RepID=UPI000E08EDFC|nr:MULTISPECIES: dihydrodipicolinate synthase family protein [unclassified Oceanispirochaeta]MBF9017990.1 dihydrodipicolinate synthase family protein [Oceanispirochaeta sp. M2]NPD74502.1 dihydrodipicolinate synthase family protein [Oceanispirochaeta sp. M1]RDG29615.1 dihydrodipicolinate synthase family protein [Oceanispirochaeta sp. M1]